VIATSADASGLISLDFTSAAYPTPIKAIRASGMTSADGNLGGINLVGLWLQTGNSVTYDGNGSTGGSVPVDSTSYLSGANATVLGNTGSLVKTGFAFAGWTTSSAGTGTVYQAGSTLAMTANTTLYAKWTPVYSVTYEIGRAHV
jgi:uncharacterized repeat protein (TIGR02543 family)